MKTYTDVSNGIKEFQQSDVDGARKTFWYLAHQTAAYSIPQILSTLAPSNRHEVTVRNSMEYRYLGLLTVEATKVKDTPAGLAFINDDGTNLQSIVDCQIAKFWLSNPTNNRLKINVYPLYVVGKILTEIEFLTWNEYLAVVIWVQSHSEIEQAIRLIKAMRNLSSTEKDSLLTETKDRVRTKDVGDQARRPWKLVANHSLVKMDGNHAIKLATSKKESTNYLESLERAFPAEISIYEEFLFTELNLSPVVISRAMKDEGLAFREVLLKPRVQSEPSVDAVTRKPRKVDYEALQKARDEAGNTAEIHVLNTERALLNSLGLGTLAQKVDRLSQIDDGMGFDILSFDSEGVEKHIEVKSVSKVAGNCSIFISANEVKTAQNDPCWLLYVVMGNGSTKPYIWNSEELTQAIRDLDVSATKVGEQIYVSAPQLELSFFVMDSTEILLFTALE